MLKTLPQKLLAGSISFMLSLSLAIFLTLATEYKPWGVPDVRRAEYEAKMTYIKSRNAKIDECQTKPRPERYIRDLAHDFGFVAIGERLSHSFTLQNVGHDTLEILSSSVPKNVKLKVSKQRIAPGASTSLDLIWRPSDEDLESHHGEPQEPLSQKIITFTTNDPIDPAFTLSLTAKPKQQFLHPKQLIFDPCSPGDSISHTFYLSSQMHDQFSISSVECDAPGFFVDHEPGTDPKEASNASLTSAHRLFVRVTPMEYGKFSRPIKISVTADGEKRELVVDLLGRVKTPITFNHPEMHRTRGLDLGTLSAERKHQFHVQVRLRGEEHRTLELFDWKPVELEATMTPQKLKGAYKLTITVPKNCPTILFNRNDHRGFVKVGDPNDPNFYNWLPFYGAVANLAK